MNSVDPPNRTFLSVAHTREEENGQQTKIQLHAGDLTIHVRSRKTKKREQRGQIRATANGISFKG